MGIFKWFRRKAPQPVAPQPARPIPRGETPESLAKRIADHARWVADNRREMKKMGITKVRLAGCQDERDCDAIRAREGEVVSINRVKLPLPGCDAPYCRCIFYAIVRLD